MGSSESKSATPPAPSAPEPVELEKPWRHFDWNQKSVLKKRLEEFTPSSPDVKNIKILVAGPIGAGKSSFINTVSNAFQERITSTALVNSAAVGKSFTKELKEHCIRSGENTLSFVFMDIMGLEPDILAGSHPDDVVNALFGHVKDGYEFHQTNPLSYKDQLFTSDPNLSDQAFCLVYVIAADTVQFTDDKLIDKLKIIRHRISEKGIPQVLVMTKVDEVCPLVKKDLKKIYTSKKIKEKMQVCCNKIGVPMNYIFPVKNYHDQIDTCNDVDVLILKALDQIVHLADDKLREENTSKQEGSSELKNPWRKFDWGQKEKLKQHLENFSVSNPDVTNIRILVAGQIGAGKSSFINSVNSGLQGEIVSEALADATTGASHSFTKTLNTYNISSECGELPFVFSDIMGLEADTLCGLQVNDIISTIFGHVMEDYQFKGDNPLTSGDECYKKDPSVSDQTFCLVYIIAADTVHIIDEQLFTKLRSIRQTISQKGIPQVIVMTKVDEACPLVKEDLKKIYTSKKIKERMEMCSDKVGVPMNNIFPVKNYHDEIDTDDDADVLILKAFDQIVRLANKKVKKGTLNLKNPKIEQ